MENSVRGTIGMRKLEKSLNFWWCERKSRKKIWENQFSFNLFLLLLNCYMISFTSVYLFIYLFHIILCFIIFLSFWCWSFSEWWLLCLFLLTILVSFSSSFSCAQISWKIFHQTQENTYFYNACALNCYIIRYHPNGTTEKIIKLW